MSSRTASSSTAPNLNVTKLTFQFSSSNFAYRMYAVDSISLAIPQSFTSADCTVTIYAGQSAVEAKKLGTATFAGGSTGTKNFTLVQNAAALLQNEQYIYATVSSPGTFKTGKTYTLTVNYRTKELFRYFTSANSSTLCTVWRYNGSSFERCNPQYYNGSAWKNCV